VLVASTRFRGGGGAWESYQVKGLFSTAGLLRAQEG